MNELYLSILTGLSIGFLGSFHCIGMCGPLALALPVQHYSGIQKYTGIFLYNLGRAMTYAIMGLIFGLIGHQFRLWGFQQMISIAAGVFLLLFVFSRFSFTKKFAWLNRLNSIVQQKLAGLLSTSKNQYSLLSIGLLNGLLPCGLVYVGIASATATMDPLRGTLLMFFFGLGTFPVMAGLMILGHRISIGARQRMNKAIPYVVSIMAIMLIVRGMNLGIPYLSPAMAKHTTEVRCAHHAE
jgi:sulfite exporter TauE/SafE